MNRPTLLVDDNVPITALAPLRAPTALYSTVRAGARVEGKIIVISRENANAKARELVAAGISQADVKYVDLAEQGRTLSDFLQNDIDGLRHLLNNPLGILSEKVRLLPQWPTPSDWQPYDINDETLCQYIRWRPRNLSFVVGDYGSGKSTFAQLLAIKLITGSMLWGQSAKMSVCAWEDDIEDFRDRISTFAGQHAQELANRVFWFEPDADPERSLDEYIDNIESLTVNEGVRIHVADPWNAFNHEFGSDNETKYVQKTLLRLQQLTRKLDTTIIVVAHLPKFKSATPLKTFRIGDASGSKEFGNKADMGFCVTRTGLLAHMLYGSPSEDVMNKMGISSPEIELARERRAYRSADIGNYPEEHMVVVTDKIKIEGMTKPRHMGIANVVKAFVVDKVSGDIVEDPGASFLAKQLW